jgi:leucine dehydrogenase
MRIRNTLPGSGKEKHLQLFERLAEYRYEQLVFCHDKATGLRAVVAIHDTTLGPALGGCRMYPYATEEDALVDVLRLARGMTYKAAASGLNLGGGKSVIIGDPRADKSEALFRSFGRYIETLGGRYIVAEDVGTSTEDANFIRVETSYVVGVDVTHGGSGDPSPFTALGVLQGMRACVEEVFGTTSLEGRTVAVQGLGHVGYNLCRLLHKEGARLIVTDLDRRAVERVVGEFGAKAVDPDDILTIPCNVFAPCALGAVINDETVPDLRCEIVAGSANNVLAESRHGEALADRGILYAPDYVINAGGLINVADELEGYNERRATKRVMRIEDRIRSIITISKRDGVPTNVAADTLALERIAAIGSMERLHTGHPYGQLSRRRETL